MGIFVVLAMFSLVSAEEELRCDTSMLNGTHYTWKKTVSSCKDCEESLCKTSDDLPVTWNLQSNVCYWSDYRELCFSGKDLTVDCGSGKLADDCGGCGGEREGCGGECRWLEGADFCVHAVVHEAPPYLSLTSSSSSGVTSKRFPEVLGVYRLSHTTRTFGHLVGYSLMEDRTAVTEKLYYFRDYRRPLYEIVSKVPFSRYGKDVVLLRNESNWLVKIEGNNGDSEFVEDPSLTMVSMETRTEHDCEFGGWQEGPCSLSCGGGVKVLTREILRDARGHGVCAGDTELFSPCASQPCDVDQGRGAQTLPRVGARNESGTVNLTLIVGLVILLAAALIGFLCYRHKYSRLPTISFKVPNNIRLWK